MVHYNPYKTGSKILYIKQPTKVFFIAHLFSAIRRPPQTPFITIGSGRTL